MPTPHTTQAEYRKWWRWYEASGWNVMAMARRRGGSRATWQHRIERARQALGVTEPRLRKTAEELPARQKRQLQDKIMQLAGQLRAVHREQNAEVALRDAVVGTAAQDPHPPAWSAKPRKASGGPGTPILLFSDAQWGETISASELDGINAYDVTVATRRYRALISKTIELAFEHMVNPRYDGIYYLRGGDMISGEIHQELRETNELQSIPAVQSLVDEEVAGIEKLADKFGKVHVITVPGNHGRTTLKPFAKKYTETNYDTLSGWMLERWFKARRDGRVTFRTPESGDAIFELYGYRFLLTHGDRIGSRGGQGFIGPAATITRGMKKLVDYYAALGTQLHYVLVGHFHTRMELEYGFANGSLPGYSEYARDFRARPAEPSQWLLFCHPHHGVTARWPVLLERKPTLAQSGAKP